MLIELIDWLVDTLSVWQQRVRRTYHHCDTEADTTT